MLALQQTLPSHYGSGGLPGTQLRSGMKRSASKAQLDRQPSTSTSSPIIGEDMRKLADEITAEKLKKQRLEWYLSEVLKEKEQLMRETSFIVQSFSSVALPTPPLPQAHSVSEAVPTIPSPSATLVSPTITSNTADEASSPFSTSTTTSSAPSPVQSCEPGSSSPVSIEDEWLTDTATLCASPSLPAELLLLEAASEKLEPRMTASVPAPDDSEVPSSVSFPSCVFAPAAAVPVEEPLASDLPVSEQELRELEQCLNLDAGWLAHTDEQELFSTIEEYFASS